MDTMERTTSDCRFIPGEEDVQLAGLARALGHPARVRILRILASHETCIGCDLVDELALAQSTVSEHLRILRTAGLVTAEPQPPRTCYRLDHGALARFKSLVANL